MNYLEFSTAFDTLVNSYDKTALSSSIQDLKFSEYEKSVFLTEAQNDLVRDYYSNENIHREPFEGNEYLRESLITLIKQGNGIKADATIQANAFKKGIVFKRPDDCWYIIAEQAVLGDMEDKCLSGKVMDVIPVRHDDINIVIKNPFKGASKTRVLRLDLGDSFSELISTYPISEYIIRYIMKPTPIILTPLEDLTIEGHSNIMDCKLHTSVHDTILKMAVSAAIKSRMIGVVANAS